MDSPRSAPSPYDDGALYDALFEEFDFGVDFYVAEARAAAGPVLDVACGTGRILLPCLEAGVEVEGLDLHAPMLERLRTQAAARGFSPRLHQADMAGFRLERRFALVMIPFNAIVHAVTVDQQLGTLTCCREHLLPGGKLVFDTFFPSPQIILVPNGQRVLEIERTDAQTGRTVRLYDTRTFDRVTQIQHSQLEYEICDRDGQCLDRRVSEFDVSWIYKREMELLLRLAGFRRWEIYGDFDRRPLDKDTDSQIVVAER